MLNVKQTEFTGNKSLDIYRPINQRGKVKLCSRQHQEILLILPRMMKTPTEMWMKRMMIQHIISVILTKLEIWEKPNVGKTGKRER